jgi:hypothetical protein
MVSAKYFALRKYYKNHRSDMSGAAVTIFAESDTIMPLSKNISSVSFLSFKPTTTNNSIALSPRANYTASLNIQGVYNETL